MDPDTANKLFHKLLTSFHMQKRLLGQQRNQVCNQRILDFLGGEGGGWKAIWRIMRISEKILATPLNYEESRT